MSLKKALSSHTARTLLSVTGGDTEGTTPMAWDQGQAGSEAEAQELKGKGLAWLGRGMGGKGVKGQ